MDFDVFAADRLGPLLRYATAVACDPHLAQDIVQEVMMRAQTRWSRIGALDAPDSYVRRMITNEYLSWRRRRAARDISAAHASLDAIGPPTSDMAHEHAERDAMRGRIARLPPKQRVAGVRRFYEDMTDDEIAGVLGCTAGTVRSHISRALSTLRAPVAAPLVTEAYR